MNDESILTREPPDPDQRITYGSDPNQFIDVRTPPGKGPHPATFFIHGGYWRARYDLTYAGHLCAALTQAGMVTWNIEFRRVGNPGGASTPSRATPARVGDPGGWPGTFEDVRSAYKFLRANPGEADLNRLCVAGHSAGGHLAFCLASFEKTITRVFSLAGVLDLRRAWELHLSNDAVREFLGGTPTEVPEYYRDASPAGRAIPQAVQKLVHGTADTSVPYEISQRYAEAKQKAGENVELITLADVGHFEIVDPASAVWPKMETIFHSLLA